MKKRKLRVFWNSNSMWSQSGYGSAMLDLLPLIRDEGFPVAICNFYGQAGSPFMLDGIKQYPVINHSFGSDGLLWHSKDFAADVAFTLQDVWVLNPQDLQQVTRWIPWLPVDHDPIPKGVTNNLRFANRVIAMSKFGQKQLADNGVSSTYIPHMVDTKIFKPMNTAEIKTKLGFKPDTYIMGMVSANKDNPPRKAFQQVLDAYKLFLEKEPKSLLYIHTDPHFPGGFPIDEYAKTLGIEQHVLFPGMQFPEIYKMKYNTNKVDMALLYNMMDVLLCPSTSEGFGVPIIEAQACGTPVIVNNWCSMPELVQPGATGEICEYITKIWSSMQSYTAIPDYKSLFDKMMLVYRADRGKMAKEATKFAKDNFDLDTTFKNSWLPYLQGLEQEIYGNSVDKST